MKTKITGKLELSPEYLKMKEGWRADNPEPHPGDAYINTNPATQPKKTVKVVTIDAQFPEIKGGNTAIGHGEATNVRAAGANAFRDLMKQPRIKGKRITYFSATISIGTKSVV